LLAFMLFDAGRDPSFLVGGVPQNLGKGYRLGKGPHFVVEGDEYDSAFFDKGSKFFHYRPRTAILTSIELDHVDIFASLADVEAAFRKFVGLIPETGLLLVCGRNAGAMEAAKAARCRVETYAMARAGVTPTPMGTAEVVETPSATRTAFLVRRNGASYGKFEVGLIGEHNIENALAAIAAAASVGVGADEVDRALRRFGGVKRRQEMRGVAAGVTV